jgi:hypothetical protein
MINKMQRALGLSALALTVLVGTRLMLTSQANVVMADANTPVGALTDNPIVKLLMILGLIVIGLVAVNVWWVIKTQPK